MSHGTPSQLNKWEDAARDCSRAIDLDESYLKAYTRRAEVYRRMGKFEEAVRDLTKAHELDRENPGACHTSPVHTHTSTLHSYCKGHCNVPHSWSLSTAGADIMC